LHQDTDRTCHAAPANVHPKADAFKDLNLVLIADVLVALAALFLA
jgi:hypothetical protein